MSDVLRGGIGLLAVVLCALPARAQEPPSAALLATSAGGALGADVASSFDRILASELEALGHVRVQGSAALRFEDVQLALGCEGETPACLGAVAREIGVRLLLLPNVDRLRSEVVLSVALFDAAADAPPRRVVRRAAGDDALAALAGEVSGLLRELLPAPAGAAIAEPELEPELENDVAGGPPPARRPRRAGPDEGRMATAGVLIFAGASGLALGVGFGVSSLERTATFERAPADTAEDAEEVGRRLVQAREDAVGANVLFVAGGLFAAAGLIWLIAEVTSADGAPDVAVAPALGPDLAGLHVAGRWR